MSVARLARGLARFAALLAVAVLLAVVPAARASTTQSSILEVSNDLLLAHPNETLQTLRSLGVGILKVTLPWNRVAPLAGLRVRPPLFDASNPNDYPQGNWAPYDTIVSDAKAYGLRVELLVDGGAPLWATAYNAVSGFEQAWSPSPTEYGQFVQAVGRRYPSVRFWELWNEPNWGASLAPQIDAQPPAILALVDYRSMLDQGWRRLHPRARAATMSFLASFAVRRISAATATTSWTWARTS